MRATCDSCEHQFSVGSNLAGKRVRCPECGDAVRIPDGDEAPVRRPKKAQRKSSEGNQAGLMIGAGAAGAAAVGLLVFAFSRPSSPPPPPVTGSEVVAPVALTNPSAQAPTATVSSTTTASRPAAVAGMGAPDGENLPTNMIQQLKESTVFIKTQIGPIGMTGSGFVIEVTGDSALIATNQHVIAKPKELKVGSYIPGLRGRDRIALSKLQMALASAQPEVSVVFNSGTSNEQTIKSEILGGIDDPDLAVVRVRGIKSPPKAIEYQNSATPIETMSLYVLGFPFGDALSNNQGNPAITVGKASVSSIRNDASGNLDKIQIDGALNPGNSGGPIVDMKGKLVGVAVQTIQGSNIGLAIPPSDLRNVLAGQVGKPEIRSAAGSYEIVVPVVDPLNKLRGVSVQFVEGAFPVDPARSGQPQLTNLSGSNSIMLPVANSEARSMVSLSPNASPKPRDVTVQASFVNEHGQTVYLDPIVVKVSAPVLVSQNANGSMTMSQTQTSGGRTTTRSTTITSGGSTNKPSTDKPSADPDEPEMKVATPSKKKSTTKTPSKKDEKSTGEPGVAVWTNKITAMKKIPDEEVTGKISGVEFTLDRADLSNGTLTLTKTPRFRGVFSEAEVRVVLFIRPNEDVSGRKYIINGGRAGDPHVTLSSMRQGDALPTTINGFDFLMVLEFGDYDVENRVQPGKIYVCTADRGKSFVAGTFEASAR